MFIKLALISPILIYTTRKYYLNYQKQKYFKQEINDIKRDKYRKNYYNIYDQNRMGDIYDYMSFHYKADCVVLTTEYLNGDPSLSNNEDYYYKRSHKSIQLMGLKDIKKLKIYINCDIIENNNNYIHKYIEPSIEINIIDGFKHEKMNESHEKFYKDILSCSKNHITVDNLNIFNIVGPAPNITYLLRYKYKVFVETVHNSTCKGPFHDFCYEDIYSTHEFDIELIKKIINSGAHYEFVSDHDKNEIFDNLDYEIISK